jgi:hypothetical protein
MRDLVLHQTTKIDFPDPSPRSPRKVAQPAAKETHAAVTKKDKGAIQVAVFALKVAGC